MKFSNFIGKGLRYLYSLLNDLPQRYLRQVRRLQKRLDNRHADSSHSEATKKLSNFDQNTPQNDPYFAAESSAPITDSPGIERNIHQELRSLEIVNSDQEGRARTPLEADKDWMRGELFQEMERFIRTQRSGHTQRAYSTDLKQFISWLRTERYAPGIDALLEYRDWLVRSKDELGAGLSRSSANRKFATVRSFLSWLQGRGFMKENPAIWVKNFRAKTESPTQGFSDAQVARVLDMASRFTRSGLQHSVILHILFYMGLRRSEIVSIRCSHFGQQRVEEDIVTTLRVQGKGDKERILPVPVKVLEVLELYLERNNLAIGMDRYLFRAVKNNVPRSARRRSAEIEDRPLNTNTIAYIVKKYAKKAGIDAQVSPHSCRATCISNALDQGATHRSVQEMAGWSSPLMIERYDKRRTSLKDSAVNIVKYP